MSYELWFAFVATSLLLSINYAVRAPRPRRGAVGGAGAVQRAGGPTPHGGAGRAGWRALAFSLLEIGGAVVGLGRLIRWPMVLWRGLQRPMRA